MRLSIREILISFLVTCSALLPELPLREDSWTGSISENTFPELLSELASSDLIKENKPRVGIFRAGQGCGCGEA